MAFVSTISTLPRTNTGRRAVCRAPRMQEASAVSTPINGDKKHEMKEMYSIDAGKKAPICRCWQSKKFPLCDGSHNKFNKETGSHVGPLVVSAAKPE